MRTVLEATGRETSIDSLQGHARRYPNRLLPLPLRELSFSLVSAPIDGTWRRLRAINGLTANATIDEDSGAIFVGGNECVENLRLESSFSGGALLVAPPAEATKLTDNSRIEAVVASNASPDVHRTWARNDDGELVALLDGTSSSPSAVWENYGKPGGVSVGVRGVAATSYFDGSEQIEHVFYVGGDGRLYEAVLDSGALTVNDYAPPSGKTLTGEVAATTGTHGGSRYVVVAVTTNDGHLYRFLRYVSSGFGTWADHSGGLSWSSFRPLAASAAQADDWEQHIIVLWQPLRRRPVRAGARPLRSHLGVVGPRSRKAVERWWRLRIRCRRPRRPGADHRRQRLSRLRDLLTHGLG